MCCLWHWRRWVCHCIDQLLFSCLCFLCSFHSSFIRIICMFIHHFTANQTALLLTDRSSFAQMWVPQSWRWPQLKAGLTLFLSAVPPFLGWALSALLAALGVVSARLSWTSLLITFGISFVTIACNLYARP